MNSNQPTSYLRAWLANPMGFGAVAPSGPALAGLITSEVSATTGRVLELGPGKGVLTRALLGRGVSEEELVLVERRPDFANLLRKEFPKSHVESMDAAEIGELRHVFDDTGLGAVISGLPLLSMPGSKVEAILASAFDLLNSGSAFYQFTYAPRAPVSDALLSRLGLRAERIGRVLLNIPPAAVYRITR